MDIERKYHRAFKNVFHVFHSQINSIGLILAVQYVSIEGLFTHHSIITLCHNPKGGKEKIGLFLNITNITLKVAICST
jgi:hypothetical protein